MAASKAGQIIKCQFTFGSSVCTVELEGLKRCLPDAYTLCLYYNLCLYFTCQQYTLLLNLVTLENM